MTQDSEAVKSLILAGQNSKLANLLESISRTMGKIVAIENLETQDAIDLDKVKDLIDSKIKELRKR